MKQQIFYVTSFGRAVGVRGREGGGHFAPQLCGGGVRDRGPCTCPAHTAAVLTTPESLALHRRRRKLNARSTPKVAANMASGSSTATTQCACIGCFLVLVDTTARDHIQFHRSNSVLSIDCCWTSLSILVHAKSLDPDPLDSQRTLERGKVRQSLLAARNSASHFPPLRPSLSLLSIHC